jgi:hypothetical protein
VIVGLTFKIAITLRGGTLTTTRPIHRLAAHRTIVRARHWGRTHLLRPLADVMTADGTPSRGIGHAASREIVNVVVAVVIDAVARFGGGEPRLTKVFAVRIALADDAVLADTIDRLPKWVDDRDAGVANLLGAGNETYSGFELLSGTALVAATGGRRCSGWSALRTLPIHTGQPATVIQRFTSRSNREAAEPLYTALKIMVAALA